MVYDSNYKLLFSCLSYADVTSGAYNFYVHDPDESPAYYQVLLWVTRGIYIHPTRKKYSKQGYINALKKEISLFE